MFMLNSFRDIPLRYDAPGNIHYVAVGLAFGKNWTIIGLFSKELFLREAGRAQKNPEREWIKYQTVVAGGRVVVRNVLLPPYGDDLYDQEMIKLGFKY
jgi:hypothetical protein